MAPLCSKVHPGAFIPVQMLHRFVWNLCRSSWCATPQRPTGTNDRTWGSRRVNRGSGATRPNWTGNSRNSREQTGAGQERKGEPDATGAPAQVLGSSGRSRTRERERLEEAFLTTESSGRQDCCCWHGNRNGTAEGAPSPHPKGPQGVLHYPAETYALWWSCGLSHPWTRCCPHAPARDSNTRSGA